MLKFLLPFFSFSLFSLFLLMAAPAFSQDQKEQKTGIAATVYCESTKAPLPFATVVLRTQNRGTASNSKGYFNFPQVSSTDTIRISYIGYETTFISVNNVPENGKIYLKKRSELVGEVIISGDDSYLYDLLYNCRKSQTNKTREAKTYFSLETMARNKQVELVECYYNGEYAGYQVEGLKFKEGRISLAKFDSTYFVSTETSKVMYMHSLYDGNKYFPYSPFELGKRELQQEYGLFLISKYRDDDNKTIYVIGFEPRENSGNFFSGKVWIDSLNHQLLKLNLKSKDATVHPFLPIWENDSLTKLEMDISKSFEPVDGEMYVSSINFNYNLLYQHEDGSLDSISTNSVLYAYNYDDQFTLPRFTYSHKGLDDYRKINLAPYNEFFWKNYEEFKLNDEKHEHANFRKKPGIISTQTLFLRNSESEKKMFHPYYPWQRKRIIFRNKGIVDQSGWRDVIPSSRYHIEAKLFLDVNKINDSLHISTISVFDPFVSYYNDEITKESIACINMYFDLIEIQRRELEEEIRNTCTTEQEAVEAYNARSEMIKRLRDDFFPEVKRGMDRVAMHKYNDQILRNLKIDNLYNFRLYQEK